MRVKKYIYLQHCLCLYQHYSLDVRVPCQGYLLVPHVRMTCFRPTKNKKKEKLMCMII